MAFLLLLPLPSPPFFFLPSLSHTLFVSLTPCPILPLLLPSPGVTLSVGLLDYGDDIFLKLDENGEIFPPGQDSGIFVAVMDELAERGGFEWRDHYGIVLPPPEGKSFTDVGAWSVNTYDISMGNWISSTERKELGMVFPSGWFDASTVLIQYSKGEEDSFQNFQVFNFTTPLTNGVWGMIVVALLYSAFISRLLHKMSGYKAAGVRVDMRILNFEKGVGVASGGVQLDGVG